MSELAFTGTKTDFYHAGPETATIVRLALALGRPLLVEGEPGCGKTMLAYAVAAELDLGEVERITVKSTSTARDLLYRFDALRRLHDAQRPGNEDAPFICPYLSLGPLGRAIHGSGRRIVLLDEIDKADVDFPNDLLEVLDTFEFVVEDLPKEEEERCKQRHGFGCLVRAAEDRRPIVFVTSNQERPLPEPFLRRCLYVHLKFPEDDTALTRIVRMNTKLSEEELTDALLDAAVARFRDVREQAIAAQARKPPTTSELVDWVRILYLQGIEKLPTEGSGLPPFVETLFKTRRDWEAFEAIARRDDNGESEA